MPLERGTIVGLERGEPNVRELGPQQRHEIDSRHAPAVTEKFAHQALGPVPANRAADAAGGDDPQSAPVEIVGQREQREVAAPDAFTLPLDTEKLPAPSNPVASGKAPIHHSSRRDAPFGGPAAVDPLRHGEALPALGAAPSQDFPAGLRAHSLAKPVRPLAPPVVRLIRALHAALIVPTIRPDTGTHQTVIVARSPCGCQRLRGLHASS